MKLFLDDLRDSPDDSWIIVRNYDDFVHYFSRNSEIITEISFDHDLGQNENGHDMLSGYDVAKWLVTYVSQYPDHMPKLEKLTIHSANPVGSENIYQYFQNAQRVGIITSNIDIRK